MGRDRLIAIGDVHGCAAELDSLLVRLAPTPDDHLVLLGDYVDRGPDARGVLDRCLELADAAGRTGPACTFLRGNHEQMMLDARAEGGRTLENWLYNGGGATLLSYGHADWLPAHKTEAGVRPDDGWAELVPEAHWDFLTSTTLYYDHPAYLFVHAGIEPGVSVAENLRRRPERFLWERSHLAPGADLDAWEKPVVCGHVKSDEPVSLPALVRIDTGAYRPYLTGKPGALTAAVLAGTLQSPRQFVQVQSSSASVERATQAPLVS